MIALLIAAQLSSADMMQGILNAGPEDAYRRCVVGSALLLEGSSDRPTDVADAADFACRVKAFEAMKGIPGEDRRANLRQSVKQAAAAMVTISRACKRDGQCEFLNIEAEQQRTKP